MCVAFAYAKATHIFSAKICLCKSYSHVFSKNIYIYAIFNDQSFNDTLTNNIVSFEQLGPVLLNIALLFFVFPGSYFAC